MEENESLADFYQRKFDWMPDNVRREIGHFNVFPLGTFLGKEARSIPYKRRDYYKVMLVIGGGEVHYADQVIRVKKQALSFSNPLIPYKWTNRHLITGGSFCIFNRHFFHQFGDLEQYSVFQPTGKHIFELADEQVPRIQGVFDRMFKEMESDYLHKYDLLRNLVFELLHFAMKLQPSETIGRHRLDAGQRISTLFMELLERQFPIEENHPQVKLRSPSDFARQLNVHVNHLNRALKKTTGKTTSQLIAERLLQEAKIMLRHSQWNISEVAFALGFSEATHFSNFFRKHAGMSPSNFRGK